MSASGDGRVRIVIFFGRERFEVDVDQMTGAELRRLFGVPADDFLYRAKGAKVDGNPIEDTEVVQLQEGMHFLSVPKDIRGGATDLGLHPRQKEEVDELEERYGAVDLEREGADALLILKVPAQGWSNDPLTVMVRIPAQYPDQRPDTIYIDAGAQPSGRGIPRLMQPNLTLARRQWNQISWHFTAAYNPARHNLVDFVNSIQIYLTSPNP